VPSQQSDHSLNELSQLATFISFCQCVSPKDLSVLDGQFPQIWLEQWVKAEHINLTRIFIVFSSPYALSRQQIFNKQLSIKQNFSNKRAHTASIVNKIGKIPPY